MLKILIVGLNFYPEPTGIGKYTGELAAYLIGRGYAVHVITTMPYYPHWKVHKGYHGWRYCRENWEGVEIIRCPLWVPHKPTGFTRLLHLASFAISSLPALASQLFWGPDIVLCIAPAILNAPFALGLARLSGAISWLHIQDFELDAALQLDLLPDANWLINLVSQLEHNLLNSFDQLSTISERMLAHLREKIHSSKKITLFPNWVDTTQIYPLKDSPNPLRVSLGLPPNQIVVLYAGTMGKKQGLEYLLYAARQLQDRADLEFILCGDGAVRTELEDLANGLPNLHFLPVQPVERLNLLLNLADIHILPQRAGAADLVMPSKLTGILASGKPVIATAPPESELGQVVSKVGVLIPPEDPESLVEEILKLAYKPDLRERLGHIGCEYAHQHFEKQSVLANFKVAMESLLIGYQSMSTRN